MNSISLTGRAVKDVELRYTSSGKPVGNGTIAVQRNFKNQQGEYEADFIDLVIWGKGAEVAAQYIKKGDKFGVNGRLQTRTYENNEGRKVKVSEVVVVDFDLPERNKSGSNQTTPHQSERSSQDPFQDGEPVDTEELDLPF